MSAYDPLSKWKAGHHEPGYASATSAEYADSTNYVVERNDGLFHIGYGSEPAPTLHCAHCGGNQFHVASEFCFTAIKCVNCLYEVGVHFG